MPDTNETLQERILRFINRHPGKDAIDIAHVFGMGDWEATELVHEMMRDGVLRYQVPIHMRT